MDAIHILLVEDNEGDIVLTIEALEEGKMMNKISIARDGKQAVDFLTKAGEFANANTPDLILLDINLPKKNGQEVLEFIKTTDKIKHIPVIMLTTSNAEIDIAKAYKNHANCYINKPVELGDFMSAIAKIQEFWFTVVKLPPFKN